MSLSLIILVLMLLILVDHSFNIQFVVDPRLTIIQGTGPSVRDAVSQLIQKIPDGKYTGTMVLATSVATTSWLQHQIPVTLMLYAGEFARCGGPTSPEATNVDAASCRTKFTNLMKEVSMDMLSYTAARVIDGVFGIVYGLPVPQIQYEELAYVSLPKCWSYFNMIVSNSEKYLFSFLAARDSLISPNRQHKVVMGYNCELRLYRNSDKSLLWASGIVIEELSSGCSLHAQNDGNLVIYTKAFEAGWSINHYCKGCSYQSVLKVKDNGNLVFSIKGDVLSTKVWSTKV